MAQGCATNSCNSLHFLSSAHVPSWFSPRLPVSRTFCENALSDRGLEMVLLDFLRFCTEVNIHVIATFVVVSSFETLILLCSDVCFLCTFRKDVTGTLDYDIRLIVSLRATELIYFAMPFPEVQQKRVGLIYTCTHIAYMLSIMKQELRSNNIK